jgi:glycosyltransferase involved in cell wall biosynthesis
LSKSIGMKVIIDHQLPFLLAHGGLQIQIERTKQALEAVGVEVEYLRWWDGSQRGDIIQFFGRANPSHIDFAHAKGMKYVMSELFTGQGSRAPTQLRLQGALEGMLRKVVPATFLANFRWDAYQKTDALLVGTPWEAEVARLLFAPPPEKIHIVPNGVEDVFFLDPSSRAIPRSTELVCTATITPRKRVVELAEAAILAETPLRILGAPYGRNDPYYQRFLVLVEQRPDLIRYSGALKDRAELARAYKEARGFALLSTMETRSLSSEEAAAAGCPLLLSDLPWARSTFGRTATYCPMSKTASTAAALRKFYDEAPTLPTPSKPCRWGDVADQLVRIYQKL